ncbi:MAG: hypothetical protein WC661_05650 [Opitutaceae bacterium]|jgi:hypothetical protein
MGFEELCAFSGRGLALLGFGSTGFPQKWRHPSERGWQTVLWMLGDFLFEHVAKGVSEVRKPSGERLFCGNHAA